MRVGVPKETKTAEARVALTPDGVRELRHHGHEVGVESTAGEGSSITDAQYAAAGAKIVSVDEAWAAGADLDLDAAVDLALSALGGLARNHDS